MHVAVVGAGSLGRVFGVRLALGAGVDVDFVVREVPPAPGAFAIARVGREERTLEDPSRHTAIPAHADVVLVCVRADQLDEDLTGLLLQGPAVPAVVLTPMLPKTLARLRARLGAERLFAAMSGVTAYVTEAGVARYWFSRTAKTLIDEPRAPEPAVTALADALSTSGIETRIEPAVHETGAATAMTFAPLMLGLDAAGSFDALLADAPLLATTFDAWGEGRALAARTGKAAAWTEMVTRFLRRSTIRIGARIARARSPEVMRFVEDHFGRRVRPQNLALGAEMTALADEKGTPHAALDSLLARLR